MKKIFILLPLIFFLNSCALRNFYTSGEYLNYSLFDYLYSIVLGIIGFGLFGYVLSLMYNEKPQKNWMGFKFGYWLAKNLKSSKESNSDIKKINDKKKDNDIAQRLEKLKILLDDKIISDEEYKEKRKKIIDDL